MNRPLAQQAPPASTAAERLAILDAVATALNKAVDLPTLLQRALRAVVERAGVDGGAVFLFDEASGELQLAAYLGLGRRLARSLARRPGNAISRLAARPETGVLVRDLSGEEQRPELAGEGIRAVAGIPLQSRGQPLGALVAFSRAQPRFPAADVELLVSIGKQIGVAVERARLYERERRRARLLETINEVGRRIGTILNRRELLPQVVHYVREHLGYESANLFLLDESGGELVLEAASGLGKEALTGYRIPLSRDSIVGWVALEREPLLANDVTREPRYHRPREDDASRAELAVPIYVGGTVLGVLDVQSSHANAFHEIDISALQTLAAQIAVAMENARLYEDAQRALARTRAFQEVATAITASLNLRPTLEHALDAAMGVFGADRAGIYLSDPESGQIRCAASRNLSATYLEEVEAYYNQAGHPSDLELLRSILVEDAQENPLVPALRDAARREGFRSMLFLPLRHYGPDIIGTFVLYHDRVRRYTDEEIALAQTFGAQAAIAIQHAWLFEAEQHAREQTATILEATRTIASSLELDQVLRSAGRCIADALGEQYCGIWLLDESGTTLTPYCLCSPPGADYDDAFRRLPTVPVTDDSPLHSLFWHGQAVAVEEGTELSPLERAIQQVFPFRSYLAVPFMARERLLGMATVPIMESGHRFRPGAVEVAMAIARSAALAVENARLYEQSQRLAVSEERNRLARELHDSVTQSLFSMTLISQALPRILERDPAAAQERIERLNELGRNALAEMRALIFQLRPAALEEEGLATALRKHTAGFQAREGIAVELRIEGERRLPAPVEEGIFRVAQEALNNVAKHARARHVAVHLEIGVADARLTVTDDGVGFDGAALGTGRRTLGLTSMRERAALLGGTCAVESAPNRGTTVRFQVPLNGQGS